MAQVSGHGTHKLHPLVMQAEQLDAQGLHDDAINQLATATQQGDLEAKTRLGKRLFTGVNSPHMPRDGMTFILEAGQSGNAEACALSSVLLASGAMGARNWSLALQALGAAAARMWVPAQEQMAILISDLAMPTTTSMDWMQVARSISLEHWLQTPPSITVHADPLLRSFPTFISPAMCHRLVKLSASRLTRAEVYDPHHRRNVRATSRTNSIAQFPLLDHEFLHLLLQEKMARACNVDAAQMEATAVLHYAPGEEITNHFDFIDPQMVNYAEEVAQNGQRIITFLIYLNDEYEEGETVFPRLDIKHRGQRGEGFYFVNCINQQPDLRTWHAGRPPLNGDKWIVSQFIRNHAINRL